ncbi:MAG TPA: glycosyltransferase family 2 protein [Trueperaceae bacterium]|nr:glycosyltransferase family 2 protein [Trueperaceae bacterium]
MTSRDQATERGAQDRAPRPELSVVVVHYRVPDILLEALRRLARAAPHAEKILVDNDPEPTLLARARDVAPGLVTLGADNHSYAHAANVGVKRARGRFVALMNPDVYLEPDTLPRLLAALRAHPSAGVAAPVARTPRGRRQDHGPLFHPNYLRLGLRPGGSVRAAWVPGYLHLLRREALDAVGGMDASLRFYNEDMDVCRRLRAAGYHARLVDAPVLHLGGSSTPPAGAFLVEGVRGGYQLSRRYLPPPLRRAHRLGLLAWATAAAAAAGEPRRRDAYREIARMARTGAFDDSPFGATLADHAATMARVPDAPGGSGAPW